MALVVAWWGCDPGAGSGAAGASGPDKEAGNRQQATGTRQQATGAGGVAGSGSGAGPASGSDAGPGSSLACRPVAFEKSIDVPEASGAAWVGASFGLPAHVVVVGDSGTRGAFAIIDADTGAGLAKGRLPLDRAASDDLEGLGRIGDTYYALTSGGHMRHFRRTGATRFELAAPAYPLTGATCDSPQRTNCGRDFEGLCLADPPPQTGCAGFAASRRDGDLVCLVRGSGGRLRPDLAKLIHVAPRRALAGCDIAPPGDGQTLYAVTNFFGGNALYRVRTWADPARATVEQMSSVGIGFIESVAAAPGGTIYRFSDTGTPTSAMAKYSCPPPGPE